MGFIKSSPAKDRLSDPVRPGLGQCEVGIMDGLPGLEGVFKGFFKIAPMPFIQLVVAGGCLVAVPELGFWERNYARNIRQHRYSRLRRAGGNTIHSSARL